MDAVDVVVAGGGPAGLATALAAQRAGLRTVVVEPRTVPVDKACGEGLMPPAVAALGRLGVTVGGHPFRGIRYLADGRRAEALFPGPPGRGVARPELHRTLWDAAVAAGVETVRGRVRDVEQDADGVRVDGRSARWLVAADGLHSPVRRTLGIPASSTGPARFGLRAHVSTAPWSDVVEVHWAADGEAYVTPLGPDLVGVAVLGAGRGGFADRLAAFPELRERIGAAPVTPALGAGPLRQRVRRRVHGRVLLVGDAAGYVDALTGEGLAIAFATAEALAARLAEGRPDLYERDHRRISRRPRLVTEGLLRATRVPAVRARVVPAAERWPRLFGAAVAQLSA